MEIFQAIVLGIVQGITEFLPISSSGHLIVIPALFGWEQQSVLFDVVVHVGTLLAILLVLGRDLIKETKATFTPGSQMGLFTLFVASVPVLGIGLLLELQFGGIARSVPVVAVSLIVWGIVLWLVDRRSAKNVQDDIQTISLNQALKIGLAQMLALIPGTSRSGITMTAGMASGLTRRAAARFSFLIAIIPIAAAGGYKLLNAVFSSSEAIEWSILIIGGVSAFLSGAFAMRALLSMLESVSFKGFAVYRVLLGVGLLIWWFI